MGGAVVRGFTIGVGSDGLSEVIVVCGFAVEAVGGVSAALSVVRLASRGWGTDVGFLAALGNAVRGFAYESLDRASFESA